VKNIQVIDGAENCSFSICVVGDEDFAEIFPGPGQDIEFIEDLIERVGEKRASELVRNGTTQRIHKRDAMGIHGTLFFGLAKRKKYFPDKREDDIDKAHFVR